MKPTTSRTGEYEVAWQEFDRNDRPGHQDQDFQDRGRPRQVHRAHFLQSILSLHLRNAGSRQYLVTQLA